MHTDYNQLGQDVTNEYTSVVNEGCDVSTPVLGNRGPPDVGP